MRLRLFSGMLPKLFSIEVWIEMGGWGSVYCYLNWNEYGLQIPY